MILNNPFKIAFSLKDIAVKDLSTQKESTRYTYRLILLKVGLLPFWVLSLLATALFSFTCSFPVFDCPLILLVLSTCFESMPFEVLTAYKMHKQ